MGPVYDTTGTGYAARRRAGGRVAQVIRAAVADAASVVHVGAGAVSYEPPDLPVVALDVALAMLPVPHDGLDGSPGAIWRRPEAHVDPAVRGAMSCFAELAAGGVEAGLTRLDEDPSDGRWTAGYGQLRELDCADLGSRVVEAGLGLPG